MKKIAQILLLSLVVIACFSSCHEVHNGQAKVSVDQSKMEFISIEPITKADTIIASNAPARITRKIRKDTDGNLIFASYQDVIMFKGKSFSKIWKSKGLESFDAFDAYEDRKGILWIASTHLGVFRINGENFTHFTSKSGLASDRTMCIHEDRRGNLWIGTDKGISFYNGKSFETLDTSAGLTHININSFLEDDAGKIWVGTKETLCFYDPNESSTKAEITFKEFNDYAGRSFKNIWSIIEDKGGDFWLGGEEGLWRIIKDSTLQVSERSTTGVFEDKKGNIWLTHRNDDPHKASLSRIDINDQKSKKPNMNHIYAGDGMFFGISEDANGDIWFGTLQGVLKYDGKLISCFQNEKQ